MAQELVPGRIGRDALERIIQRAAELQAAELDTGEGITEPDLLKLGSEVGIPAPFLQQALYEERVKGALASERGLIAALSGPTLVHAARVVPGEKATLEQALSDWMSEEEALTVKRHLPDRTVWERQRGLFAEMRRGLGMGGRAYHLSRAVDVSVALRPLEAGYVHVALTADLTNSRNAALGGAAAVLVIGVLAAAVFPALGFLTWAAPIPLALGAAVGLLVARHHRNTAGNTQLALEQVLDRMERGEIRPRHRIAGPRASAFMRIADEIKRSMTG